MAGEDRVSFTLKADVENFVGGQIAYGSEGKHIDLEPLSSEGALLTVASPLQVNALRGVEVLKEVPTPEKHKKQEAEEDEVLVYTPRGSRKEDKDEGGGG